MMHLKDLVANNTLTQEMSNLLTDSIHSGVSILIIGSPSSGKSTLMQSLIPYMHGRSILAHTTFTTSDYPADDKRFHFCERVDLDALPEDFANHKKSPVKRILAKHGDYVLVEDAYSLVDESTLNENGLVGSLNTLAPLADMMNHVGVMSIVDLSVEGYGIDAFSENTIDKMPEVHQPYIVVALDLIQDAGYMDEHKVMSIHEAMYGATGFEEVYDGIYKPTSYKTALNKLFDYNIDNNSHETINAPSKTFQRMISK